MLCGFTFHPKRVRVTDGAVTVVLHGAVVRCVGIHSLSVLAWMGVQVAYFEADTNQADMHSPVRGLWWA